MQLIIKILISLGMQLLTEQVLKHVLVSGMEAVVKRTANQEDDKLVKIVKDAWKVE